MANSGSTEAQPASFGHAKDANIGLLLVGASALIWSFGGSIARALSVEDSWTIVFWRSVFAAALLLLFMLLRDGPAGTLKLFRKMGWAGIAVAFCFATASTSFIVALAYTTVANILLIQAGVPLFAALIGRVVFGERVSAGTALAIAAVIFGVAVMVSESFTGKVSPIGDGLSVVIAVMFATATVITRRHSYVRMTPAVFTGTIFSATFAACLAQVFIVSTNDFGWLFAFGSLNMGLGLICFVTGARLIPAPRAALIGTLEPVMGPIWVWIFHGEVPSLLTVVGGGIVFAALLGHLLADWLKQQPGRATVPPAAS